MSVILAISIMIPSFTLMGIGARDAGEETLSPKKEHTLYGGIYNTVRHPQAWGEVWVGLIVALALHRTFLFLFEVYVVPSFLLHDNS